MGDPTFTSNFTNQLLLSILRKILSICFCSDDGKQYEHLGYFSTSPGGKPPMLDASITTRGGVLLQGTTSSVYTKTDQYDHTSLIKTGSERNGYGDLSDKYIILVRMVGRLSGAGVENANILTVLKDKFPYLQNITTQDGFTSIEINEQIEFKEREYSRLQRLNGNNISPRTLEQYTTMLDTANQMLP